MKQQWTIVIETSMNGYGPEPHLKVTRHFVQVLLEEHLQLPRNGKHLHNGVWVGVKSIKERKK